MLNVFIQNAAPSLGRSVSAMFRHLGALGLFSLAILDGSPLPTFGGPDILTAILAARHGNPWYEYTAVATAGSVIGAYLTFRVARRAGAAYLQRKFGNRKLGNREFGNREFGNRKTDAILRFFHKWGTSALAVSAAVPFPFPTSVLFAAAGASNYSARRFLTVVTICRGVRYTVIAIIAEHYGRNFVRVLRQPGQYWGWLLLLAAALFSLIIAGIVVNRRLTAITSA
jgi:membrane protein YqaA with SNARE-associated domain